MTSNPKDEVHYFYEDVVYRVKRNGAVQFGMVIENSEFASSDEDNDEDDHEILTPGRIRIAWHPNGEEEVVKEKHVGLADRSLMPGDVVRRLIVGKDTQRGYCRETNVRASIEIVGTQQVIFDVDSKDLVPLEEFTVDVAVCLGIKYVVTDQIPEISQKLGSWIGMIKSISSTITLKFPDGSMCDLNDEDALELEDVLDKRDSDCEFKRYDFYPGQVLSGPLKAFESADFTFTSEEMKNTKNSSKSNKVVKAMVDKVKVKSVVVNWQCRAYAKDSALSDLNEKQPSTTVEGPDLEKIRMLNVFEPCTLQIGDRNYYTLKQDDVIMMRDEWRKLEKESYLKPSNKSKGNNKKGKSLDSIKKRPEGEESSEEESDVEIETKATTSTKSSKPSVQASTLSKKKKLKRSRKNSDRTCVTTSLLDLKPGDKVIVETLSTKSEATVVWQDGSIEENISSRELFPIHALDDQEFFPGDFTVRINNAVADAGQYAYDPHSYGVIQNVDHAGRTCSVKWFKTYTTGNEPQPLFVGSSLEPVYDLRDHPDFKYRPGSIVIRVANFNDMIEATGGQVLDNYTSGQVLVWWANNTTSACWPQDLYKIGEYDSDDGELWDENDDDFDDDNQSESSWETASEEDSQTNNDLDGSTTCIRSRLAASIERARIAMTKLEDIFNDKTNNYTSVVIKQLLDVYKNCRYLDKLMNTDFFNESHFEDLLDKVRERSKSISAHQAVQDQMQRLFSEASNNVTDDSTDSTADELNQICARLCSLIKAQLVKSHDEVMARYGGQAANFTADDLTQSPGEEDLDLTELMTKLNTHSNTETEVALSNPPAAETESVPAAIVDEQLGDNPAAASGGSFYKTTSVSNYDLSNALYGIKDEDNPVDNSTEILGEFTMIETSLACHKFKLSVFQPNDPKNFIKFVRREVKLLRSSLPHGIRVKGYEDRMDLYSVMIKGAEKTPYEDGLFFFDFQLSADYPKAPPVCFYHSFVSDRLNPNLYEDGKVCVSLLGTWSGKGTETWTPNSNLLQLLVSIQGLILVSEPYFNEAGYERQKGTQQGLENSRMYNEMVVLKVVQSMTRMVLHPPEAFKDEVMEHMKENAHRMIDRIESWRQMSLLAMNTSSSTTTPDEEVVQSKGPESFKDKHPSMMPDFPLVPASKGFCLSLEKSLEAFKTALKAANL